MEQPPILSNQSAPSAPSIYCVSPCQSEISSHDNQILTASAECLFFEANYAFGLRKFDKALHLASLCYLLHPSIKSKALDLMSRCTQKISPQESSVKLPTTAKSTSVIHDNLYAEIPVAFSRPVSVEVTPDDSIAQHFLREEDLFDMLSCKPWDRIEDIEKAHKRAIVSVHSDRNKSPMATEATAKLMAEMKKFRASPSQYTKDMEQKRAIRGIRDAFVDPTFDRDGYGKSSASEQLGQETLDPLSGFDRDGKRSYTWSMSAGPKRHVDCNPEAGIGEAKSTSALFAHPLGEQAWMARIEYSEDTAHKFSKSGKYQTFSEKGVSASKHGTKFVAKNK